MKILLTGFEPFGGEPTNPSWQAVQAVDECEAVELRKFCLPVSFQKAPQLAIAAIERERPDAVICVGQAGGRTAVSIERIAVNLANAKNPDNDGYRPINQPVCEDGPGELCSTLPVNRLVEAVTERGIPCRASDSAGRYVCNTLFYRLLHRFPSLPIGFIHLPYSDAQTSNKAPGTSSIPLQAMTDALSIILRELASPTSPRPPKFLSTV